MKYLKTYRLFEDNSFPLINQKYTDIEFDLIKDCKFNTLSEFTLQDIVDNWDEIKNIKNDNISTIKYFVNNEQLLSNQCLIYDKKGLADGFHRLTAMKILGIDKFCYQYVDDVDEYLGD